VEGELLVVALGGNAIKQAHEEGTTEEQFRNIDRTALQLAQLIHTGYRVVITHGNGPQAGALLIQQEECQQYVPAQDLAVCGAMTQGQIGWMIQNRLSKHLVDLSIDKSVCTVITQVVVSEDDPDFLDPTKPVGPFYTKEEATKLEREKGYVIRQVKPGSERGWRRVVPSPEPIDIVEKETVDSLLRSDIVLIACGGGGIPVIRSNGAGFRGIEAVIDKDRAGFKLAQVVGADLFLILTDVDHVYTDYDSSNRKILSRLTLSEGLKLLEDGHFGEGSMKPKVQAALRFVEWSGKKAIITSLNMAMDALEEKTGTHIYAG
jgi:carbamate kinase